MTAQGKANYEAYRKASGGVSLISGSPLPEWDMLGGDIRWAWDAGADAVEAWVAEAPVDEDMPGGEPKPATVIVTDANGCQHRYASPSFGMLRDGTLVIGDKLDDGDIRVDAARAPGHWAAVCKDEAIPDDSTARALEIARRALVDILKRSEDGGDQPFGRPEIGGIANRALEGIWTETEG